MDARHLETAAVIFYSGKTEIVAVMVTVMVAVMVAVIVVVEAVGEVFGAAGLVGEGREAVVGAFEMRVSKAEAALRAVDLALMLVKTTMD